MILDFERPIFWRFPSRDTCWDGLNDHVQGPVVEEGDRVPIFVRGWRQYTVHGTQISVVRPPLHEIADIDNICAFDGSYMVPCPRRLVEDFEATDIVLEEKCESTEIGVRSDSSASTRRVRRCCRVVM